MRGLEEKIRTLQLPTDVRWCPKRMTDRSRGRRWYAVRGSDAVRVVLPVRVSRRDFKKVPKGAGDAAAHPIIEEIKRRSREEPDLYPLSGKLLDHKKVQKLTEPCTVVRLHGFRTPPLWMPGKSNRVLRRSREVLLTVRMLFPPDWSDERVLDGVYAALDALREVVREIPRKEILRTCDVVLDQRELRERLERGEIEHRGKRVVALIGDGARPARRLTDVRRHHRIAGPKPEPHIPFEVPEDPDADLVPLEIELPRTGERKLFLPIYEGELFAIAGANAQGKTTLVNAVEAGQDDHAPGDGREYVITVRRTAKAEAGIKRMNGEDVSLFFRELPPGYEGTPENVRGLASGSMKMAAEIQRALEEGAKILFIDEDKAAVNLLVPGVLTKELEGIRTLVEVRDEITSRGVTIVAATGVLDDFTAAADRAIVMEDHRPKPLNLREFRARLARYYLERARRYHSNAEGPEGG
ncbi:P-loop domain-containing protein [Methanopyrus kandleri]